MHWDLEVDVVCVGSGIGGLAAAVVAHDQGLRTVVLEKAESVGGVTAYSLGEVWVPANHVASAAGLEDSREAALAYLEFMAGGYADRRLMERFVDNAPLACRYFGERAGVRWKVIRGFPDYYYPKVEGTRPEGRYLEVEPLPGKELGEWQAKTRRSPHAPSGVTHDEMFSWGGMAAQQEWDWELYGERIRDDYRSMGPGVAASFVKAALVERGIPAHLATPARALVEEGGEVVGVRAEQAGREVTIRAGRGVILAVAGYDWNPQLVRYYEHVPEWHSAVPPQVEGDNLVLGGEVGAAVATVPPNLAVLLGFRIPGEEHEGKPLWRGTMAAGLPHAIMVNRAGRRFGDESFYRDYLPRYVDWDGRRQGHRNLPCFMIFDRQFRERYALGPIFPDRPLPEGLVAEAATLGELADRLDIDARGLESTVTRFNEDARRGVDTEYGRGTFPWSNMFVGDPNVQPNPNLGPLDTPPYFGLRLSPIGMGINAAGLKIDADARVMHVRGHPIPGLYAAGNAAAFLEFGSGYQSGFALARGMTWGFLAARHAAERSPR